MQKIALYSNGMAVFTRTISLENNKPTQIELPVKSEYLDEVLSSLEVYGEVEVIRLPSYTPADFSAEKLDVTNMQSDLLKKFSGQDVRISLNSGNSHEGKLFGLQDRNANSNGVSVQLYDVLVYKDGKVRVFAAEEVENVEFPAERIKSEINKLLNVASQLACPDSKTISMTLKGNGKATLQFTVPVAAWKMRYGLRLTEDSCELNGQAIVDNNTDEDWKDATLTVITGEPISFSTDLAEVKVPKRTRSNLVKEQATGAIVASDSLDEGAIACCSMESVGGAAPGVRAMNAKSARAAAPLQRASRPQANIREAGAYFQYTYQQPTTVPANQSSIIPLFNQTLKEAKKVLYFNANENEKVFRAISLKNELLQDLGSGVCTLFENDTYLGKCILKDTPRDRDCFLIYAVESGVAVKREVHPPKENIIAINKNKRALTTLTATVATTTYTVQNKKDQDFVVEIDHAHGPCKFDVLDQRPVAQMKAEAVETKTGHKIRFVLPKKTKLSFLVRETMNANAEYNYDANSFLNWLSYCGSKISGKFESKAVQELIKIHGKLADINTNAAEFEEKLKNIAEEQKRLLLVLKGTEGHSDMATWKKKLAKTETDIETAQAGIASCKAETKQIEAQLNDLFTKIELDWKSE